jgi:hypothetical protein
MYRKIRTRATNVAPIMMYWNVWKYAPRSMYFPFVVYEEMFWYLSSTFFPFVHKGVVEFVGFFDVIVPVEVACDFLCDEVVA